MADDDAGPAGDGLAPEAAMRTARTGVVVLNYGDPGDTVACVESLERSDDLDLDLVVVDNGPADLRHDELRDLIGRRGETIATGANLGYAGGNNVGVARVLERGCDVVWILNPDTVVERDTLSLLRGHLDAVGDCGIVGPRLVLPGSPPRIWFDGGLIDLDRHGATGHVSLGRLEWEVPPRAVDVDYVTGASLLVRRAVVEQIGPLPEHYFLYYEEADWCVRARRAGWRTMVEQRARMLHRKRSSGNLPTPYFLYYMTRNRYTFADGCLGADGEAALADFDIVFLQPWRARVEQRAPAFLGDFDHLVHLAREDARAGRVGRNDQITDYPTPEVTHGDV